MPDFTNSAANWVRMQSWFVDKTLRNDKWPVSAPGTLNNRAAKSAYLSHRHTMSQVNTISRIDYQDALFEASRSMIRFKKPSRLIRMISRIIGENVGVTHLAVMVYDSVRKSYVLAESKGVEGRKIPQGYIRLDLKSALVELLSKEPNSRAFEAGIIGSKDLEWALESGHLLNRDACLHNKLRSALREMELLDAEVCIPCFFKKELLGMLILGGKNSGRGFTREELNLFATLANDAAIALANARLIEHLKRNVDEVNHLWEKEHRLFMNTAAALAKAIDARDVYTHGHTGRVTKYCAAIAGELDHTEEVEPGRRFDEILYITALLHDIGKIGVPDRILNKQGKLNSSERKIVEKHPEIGASIIFPISELNVVAVCVRAHQEWYNGNGYPQGLKNDEIPLISRIVSVADAFDAMTSDRPYRKKRSSKDALKEISRYSGTQFDPDIVKAFLKGMDRVQGTGDSS